MVIKRISFISCQARGRPSIDNHPNFFYSIQYTDIQFKFYSKILKADFSRAHKRQLFVRDSRGFNSKI